MKYGTEADIDCSGAAIVSIAVALVLCLGKKKKIAGQRDAAQGTILHVQGHGSVDCRDCAHHCVRGRYA